MIKLLVQCFSKCEKGPQIYIGDSLKVCLDDTLESLSENLRVGPGKLHFKHLSVGSYVHYVSLS